MKVSPARFRTTPPGLRIFFRFQAFTRLLLLLTAIFLSGANAFAEQRFPPPDFEGGYKLPLTQTPAARAMALQYLDVAVLLVSLAVAVWLIYRRRSRRGIALLSLFSLGYFGFYRKGCICAIGSVQNVALGLFDNHYALPLTVIAFFVAPIVVSLFAGRAFCAAVCPHGAIQDLVLLKPVRLPSWVDHALGLIPYFFLGAGAIFAATGSAFVICRFDPFVPFFRLSGSSSLLAWGAALLLLGVFVGRPYCRFLCPYGALLRMTSAVAKWRVRVTPNACIQCGLCRQSCPFGVIREPDGDTNARQISSTDRRRLGWLIVLLPLLICAGAFGGSKISVAASRLDPAVTLAERYVSYKTGAPATRAQETEPRSLQRVDAHPEETVAAAIAVRNRFVLAGALFGSWVGLVIGVKLIGLSIRQKRTAFEPDSAACFACARCFNSCPNERVRLGLMPEEDEKTATETVS